MTRGAAPIIELSKKAGMSSLLPSLLPFLLSFTFFEPTVRDKETKDNSFKGTKAFQCGTVKVKDS
jgi:hypothetical protein